MMDNYYSNSALKCLINKVNVQKKKKKDPKSNDDGNGSGCRRDWDTSQ